MNDILAGGASPDENAALRARIRDLETALNQKNLDIAVTFQLTPALANLLGVLLSLPLVTADTVQHRLEIVTDPKVAIHRLRKMLARWHGKLGLAADGVLIQGRRHVGYWIEPEHKALLNAAIERGSVEPVTQQVTEQAA
jgi:hypothetical protein